MSFAAAFKNFKPYAGAKNDILASGSPMGGLFALLKHKTPATSVMPAAAPVMPTHQPPVQMPMLQPNTTAMDTPRMNPMGTADDIQRRKAILKALGQTTRY